MIQLTNSNRLELQPSQKAMSLGVICDYLEEGWISMNFCAEMLLKFLQEEQSSLIQATSLRPDFRHRFAHLPWIKRKISPFAADRTLNCFWDYPRYLKQQVQSFDYFHICDHSYAHLVHALPAERTGVFCHDLDAFRTILYPEKYSGSLRYNASQSWVLKGLQKAAVVFYTTSDVRQQIEAHQLIDPSRLVQAPLGIAPEFTSLSHPLSEVDRQALAPIGEYPFLLSVSSNSVRKRLDVLLDVFAAVRSHHPHLKLVRVGRQETAWTSDQQAQIDRYQMADSILYLHGLERTALAELYRRAALVLVTSESEGFGLPVIEALACGAGVVASDIPVLREVGGTALTYCPVGDIQTWTMTVHQLLSDTHAIPPLSTRLAQATQYSWSSHAETIAHTYLHLVD